MKYLFSLKGLKDIPFQKYDKDFTFIVDGKRYQTARIVADLLSPKVRKLHFIDPSITEFDVDTCLHEKEQKENDDKDYFQDFLQIIISDEIEIGSKQQKYYSRYFYALGNINEYLRLQPEYSSPLSVENAVDRLLEIERITINFSEVIDHHTINVEEIISFIASHFYDLPKEQLKRLSVELLNEILNSRELKISDEDCLLDFLIELYKEDHLASELFSTVIYKNVSERSLEQFVKTVAFDDINSCTWSSFCQQFISGQTACESRYAAKKNKYKEFKPEQGREFDGIMQYLVKETGGNIHDNGTIEITSNSFYSSWEPKKLADLNCDCCYQAKNESDVFVCFDFKSRRIQLSNYSIKSYTNGENNMHLRNWTIEVSNNGENWEEIDRHTDDTTLNGSNKTATFKVSKERSDFYRFVRIHQTGYSWYEYPNSNRYDIQMRLVEFFGKLDENKDD